MKAILTYVKAELYHIVNGEKKEGLHSGLRGDVSGLSGDVSGLRGDVSGLSGDVSGLIGNVSPYLRGDVNDCELSEEERKSGIDVKQLCTPASETL